MRVRKCSTWTFNQRFGFYLEAIDIPHDQPRYTMIDSWGVGVFLTDAERIALNRGEIIDIEEIEPSELRMRIDDINLKD